MDLTQIDLPSLTPVAIYKNGDGTHKIICKNIRIRVDETTTAIGTLTIHRAQGITMLNNFDEMRWEDVAVSDGKLYCLPNEEDKIYDVTINSIMN